MQYYKCTKFEPDHKDPALFPNTYLIPFFFVYIM